MIEYKELTYIKEESLYNPSSHRSLKVYIWLYIAYFEGRKVFIFLVQHQKPCSPVCWSFMWPWHITLGHPGPLTIVLTANTCRIVDQWSRTWYFRSSRFSSTEIYIVCCADLQYFKSKADLDAQGLWETKMAAGGSGRHGAVLSLSLFLDKLLT